MSMAPCVTPETNANLPIAKPSGDEIGARYARHHQAKALKKKAREAAILAEANQTTEAAKATS